MDIHFTKTTISSETSCPDFKLNKVHNREAVEGMIIPPAAVSPPEIMNICDDYEDLFSIEPLFMISESLTTIDPLVPNSMKHKKEEYVPVLFP